MSFISDSIGQMIESDIRALRIKAEHVHETEKHSIMSNVLLIESKYHDNPILFEHFYTESCMYLSQKLIPVSILDKMIRELSKMFLIPTNRIFVKHNECQRLILALNYQSWMPFIEKMVYNKADKSCIIQFSQLTYVDKLNIIHIVANEFKMSLTQTIVCTVHSN